MKILLLGEYSRLHNTLKKGLSSLGHSVTLVGDGDGFKNFPVDISIKAVFVRKWYVNWFRQGFYRLFKFDLGRIETGIRFYFQLHKLKNFDVVQLINEQPIKTIPVLERYLLKRIFVQNSKTFVLSCGVDTLSVAYILDNKLRYSLLDPYNENPNLKEEFGYVLDYTTAASKKTHRLVFEQSKGVIASDYDYVLPLKDHPKFLGLIPNPATTEEIEFIPLRIGSKINIFLGINRGNYHAKGIPYFEEALKQIQAKFGDHINVIRAENIPYAAYLRLYKEAHIILDQVYSYDQGYNALEAMAQGKVVFTGAEKEFLEYYKLQEDEVCVNALPDSNYLVKKLSFLIENPSEILQIGTNARKFVEKEHHWIKIAEKYVAVWNQFSSEPN
jgi:glycosyltransferase involved in cell wall biosynthesis